MCRADVRGHLRYDQLAEQHCATHVTQGAAATVKALVEALDAYNTRITDNDAVAQVGCRAAGLVVVTPFLGSPMPHLEPESRLQQKCNREMS
jgi:hypothetical protein